MKKLVIDPLPVERIEGDYVRRCRIHRIDDAVTVSTHDLWYRFPQSIEPPDDADCDSYVLAVLMDAMKEGRDVTVKGTASKELLSNLVEFQSAWQKWRPDEYSIIQVEVEALREHEQEKPGAICAFSGGVDAVFSVWRHTQKKNSYRSFDIKLCALVHGFDIPLKDPEAFNRVLSRAQSTLDDVGLKILPIKTNYRAQSVANWEDAHVTALAAALSNFKNHAGTCIVGSAYPYNYLKTPWGSNPMTDHLLSSGQFRVVHDGASHTRTEKVNEIANWKAGRDNLRVCWEGAVKDRNCGVCEKCIRTRLNFMAGGHSVPGCLNPNPESEIDFSHIHLPHAGVRGDWQQIIDYADKNGIHDPWVAQAKQKIKESLTVDANAPGGGCIKSALRFISNRMNRGLH